MNKLIAAFVVSIVAGSAFAFDEAKCKAHHDACTPGDAACMAAADATTDCLK